MRSMTVPARTPRNPVVRALARLARTGHGRHASTKRKRDKDRADLDQRVRECGEW